MNDSYGFGFGSERLRTILRAFTKSRDADKFVGRPNELVYDPCGKRLMVHDGCHAGGCAVFIPFCDSVAALPIGTPPCLPAGTTVVPQLCNQLSNLPVNGTPC